MASQSQMRDTSDTDASDWKQKYLNCLDKLERKEHSWEELESLLRLAMTRVSLAAEGVDAQLDKHLGTLRKSIRSSDHYPGLEAIVEDITRTVKRLDEQRKDPQEDLNNPANLLNGLLDQLDFPKTKKKHIKQLRKQLKSSHADQSLEQILRDFAELVNDLVIDQAGNSEQSASKENQSSGKGLLSRLFNSDDAAKSYRNGGELQDNQIADSVEAPTVNELSKLLRPLAEKFPQQEKKQLLDCLSTATDSASTLVCLEQCINPLLHQESDLDTDKSSSQGDYAPSSAQTKPESHNETWGEREQQIVADFCLKLIEALHFPKEFESHVDALRDTVTQELQIIESGSIIHKIADLMTATRLHVEKEKQELQDFLRHLTEHLQDIDQRLSGAETHRLASVANSNELDAAVHEQMNDIESSVHDASELGQLKVVIQDRLSAIRSHLGEHRRIEAQHQLHLEKALEESNARLHDLENESKQLRDRLNKEHLQAIHDTLTGVFNRLAYEERMEQEYARWKRYNQPLVLLVFDVDHFKSINDTYGHKAGDKALRLIAKTLNNNLRESDFLARYGGEEFVVIMPQTELNAAINAANKLREAVQTCQFHYQEERVKITISCGATQFKADDTPETAFQRADEGLYKAKQNGRNRCEPLL